MLLYSSPTSAALGSPLTVPLRGAPLLGGAGASIHTNLLDINHNILRYQCVVRNVQGMQRVTQNLILKINDCFLSFLVQIANSIF